MEYAFDAGSGDTVPLERVIPREGDAMSGDVSPEAGLPVYTGQAYQFAIDIEERDPANSVQRMGYFVVDLNEAHDWGIGTAGARSWHDDKTQGDYVLYYEVRRAPLPDLRMSGFEIAGVSSAENVCGRIENVGQRPSGPFSVALSTEGKVVGGGPLASLDAGASTWTCVPRADLPVYRHNLVFSIDEARQIPEMEERNNADVLAVPAVLGAEPTVATPVTVPSPQPKANGARADLKIRSIRVRGREPDGERDCAAGTNDVAVVVKNAGSGDGADFTVRLSVNGRDVFVTMGGLQAGEERSVAFSAVPLKKGEQKLTATVDPDGALDESDEDNNELKVSARCANAA
jgi:hypothetical protein